MHIACDKIVSVAYLRVRYHTADECILCRTQTLLVLETNAFHAGDEHFSAGNECIENVRSNFSHAHTQLATSDFQTVLMLR